MTTIAKVYRRSELECISEGCLRRYDAIWRQGVDDTSDLAMVGIAGHAVSYAYVTKLFMAGIPQDAELADEAFIEGIATTKTPARLIPEIKHVWQFFAERFELPIERFVAAEEKQLSGDVGWTPDLVLAHPERNELEIQDWKWGWNPPMTEDALRTLFQARVYSRYGFDRWPNFTSYRFTLHAVRFNKFVSVTFKPSDLDSVDVELKAAIATIQRAESENVWPAVPGPACGYCQLVCPVVDEKPNLPKRLLFVKDAEAVARWLLPESKAVSAAKKILKAYCAQHGGISVGGMVWDHYPSIERTYPVSKVLDVLKTRGVMGAFDGSDEAPGLTFSHSALAKLFKAYPQLEKDLESVRQEKPSYRFMAKKPGIESGDEE